MRNGKRGFRRTRLLGKEPSSRSTWLVSVCQSPLSQRLEAQPALSHTQFAQARTSTSVEPHSVIRIRNGAVSVDGRPRELAERTCLGIPRRTTRRKWFTTRDPRRGGPHCGDLLLQP